MNSIESLEREEEWKALALDEKIANSFHLVGLEYESKIVLFGGLYIEFHHMYTLNAEAELEHDFSDDQLIPSIMCGGSIIVQDRRIYDWDLCVFDRGKWSHLS